jgi:MEDS: MEthanogen/methylotroph, DcmR Sensory domain
VSLLPSGKAQLVPASRATDGHDPNSKETDRAIRIGGAVLGDKRHICAFFNSHDDHYRVLLPFIQEGFARGEKAVHIIDPQRCDDHIRRLSDAGIDALAAQHDGQLDLRDWAHAHLREGFFDQDRTLRLIDDIRRSSTEQGFSRIRFVTHMEWAIEGQSSVDALLEYEATANLRHFEDVVVCAYDLSKFSGDIVVEVMRTHPMIIIGGMLQENPFFVPPDQFLRELRERRGARPRQRSA